MNDDSASDGTHTSHVAMFGERPQFEITEGHFGQRMILDAPWSKEAEEEARRARVRGFNISGRVNDLSFLREFPEAESVSLLHGGADLEPLHSLKQLKRIYLVNVKGFKVDFTNFPLLEECSLEWSPGVSRVFEASSLKQLYIGNLDKKYTPCLSRLTRLRKLTLLGCATDSLDVLADLKCLEQLRIARMNKLLSNKFLMKMSPLTNLFVQGCTAFTSLESLRYLRNLEDLALERVGDVESLRPLAELNTLRSIVLMGPKTTLLDGDLSQIWALPNLERLSIPGRGGFHWTKPGSEFDKSISGM